MTCSSSRSYVDETQGDTVNAVRITYCETLPKHRFKFNLYDKGAAKSSDIPELVPHPNFQRGGVYELSLM